MIMQRFGRFVGSRSFFAIVLTLFVVQAVWVAITLRYPAIFDESWHVGIIRLYAAQWSPLLTHQAADTYNLGALTRDPSFLYHYIMSFPYHLVVDISSNLMTQVMVLRFIDIAFFTSSLVLFRLVLLKVKATPVIVHVALFFFILVPVVPFLAAQINYDNLLMPLTALAFLLTLQFRERLLAGNFDTTLLVLLVTVALFACVTQFEFLPIWVAIFAYFPYAFYRFHKQYHSILPQIAKGWLNARLVKRIIVMLLAISALILFAYSYGVNVVLYHTPTPDCNQVLTTKDCLQYYAFNRNYTAESMHTKVDANPLLFSIGWIYRMFEYSFYTALNQPTIPYQVLPLPLPALAAMGTFVVGLVLVWRYRKKIMGDYPGLMLLVWISSFYALILWGHNYNDFITIGLKVGINGRYLFPVILPIMLTVGIAFQYFLRGRAKIKAILLTIIGLLFLNGGGIILYIISSDPTWWWAGHPWIIHMAQALKDTLKPVIVSFKLFR